MYLARYHDVTVSRSGVWRILKRLDMNRLPTSQRYQRHGRRWKCYGSSCPATGFIEPLTGSAATGGRKKRYYQFAAIDDCTRIRVLRIYERDTRKNAIQFIDYVLAKLSSSCRPTTAPSSRVASTGTCSTAGSATTTSSPRPPAQRQSRASPRIDHEEFYRLLDGIVIDDAQVFNQKLQEWQDFYNFNRPDGGLDGQTPYDRLRGRADRAVVTAIHQSS